MLEEENHFDQGENFIAIVGMAGRFPQSNTVREFWHNLLSEKECIQHFSEAELVLAGVEPALVRDPKYVRASATLGNTDKFDAEFFGINPAEAALLDPQHRFFLETVWHVLEDAACDPERFSGRIGIYASCALSSYLVQNLLTKHEETRSLGVTQAHMSTDKDFLPACASYLFNLTGPSVGVGVGAACSASLVAVHQAVQSLLNFETDLALAGGVSIRANQVEGHLYQESGILSPDGHCRPFDAKAQGTVVGSGVGVVALKRLSEALENRDSIYAVIRGSAINNDGQLKAGFDAACLAGQAEVITEAQAVAGIDAGEIGYVEAHGIGTVLGDSIELAALSQAFSACESEREYQCAIGSLKSNMGHMDGAAGVAGLIKVALCVSEALIPASLNYQQPNPKVNFDQSPFFVNKKTQDWSCVPGINQERRIAAVSSFGIGGTNAHVVVEEPPVLAASESNNEDKQILLISAKSKPAIAEMRDNLCKHLADGDNSLGDVAFTLQDGRKALSSRHAILVDNKTNAIDLLQDNTSGINGCVVEDASLVFLFPGQGNQYSGMAKELYQSSVEFKRNFDICAQYLNDNFDLDLNKIIFEAQGEGKAEEVITQTQYTQPAIFAVEYSLAKTLEYWGVEAKAMIGHSLGEYVAATMAGVFSLEDALHIVCHRGRLMQKCQPGSMLSIEARLEDVQQWLGATIDLAGHNSVSLCLVAGPTGDISRLEKTLEEKNVKTKFLNTSHAFHSHMMDPILAEFEAELENISFSLPQRAFISNVTGTWISNDEVSSRKYWVSHLRSAVLFADGIDTINRDLENIIWLEVGPGRALASMLKSHMGAVDNRENNGDNLSVINCLPPANPTQNSASVFNLSLARLWAFGVEINWHKWHDGKRLNRLHLPLYPFQRKSYWG